MKNSADRGGCYSPRPQAEVDNTLRDLQNSSYPAIAANSIIALLFIQNNSNFKNKLTVLTSVDVKFTSIVHLSREIQQIKVCSGLQIYSKQQMLSVELTCRCSCYVFRQYFAVKRVQCPSDSSAILFKQPKQLTLVPRFPRSTVQYDSSAAGYGETMRVLLGNQNRRNILNE